MEGENLWHVYLRGNNRQDIFYDRCDYIQVINRLAIAADRKGVKVWAYCFLSNHLHLLVECGECRDLSAFMHYFRMSLTHWFNARYKSIGNVGTRKYGRAVIKDEEDLAQVLTYILRNPLWHGITEDFFDYPWSTIHCYFKNCGFFGRGARDTQKNLPVYSGFLTEKKEIARYLPSGVSLPEGYKMSLSGLILPECYICIHSVEEVYGSFRHFMDRISEPSRREINISKKGNDLTQLKSAGRIFAPLFSTATDEPQEEFVRKPGRKSLIPDGEITEFLAECLDPTNPDNPVTPLSFTELDFGQKMQMARFLKEKFPRAAFKQLARILYIPETTLRRHW